MSFRRIHFKRCIRRYSTGENKCIKLSTVIRGQLIFGKHTQRNENIIKKLIIICPIHINTDRSFSFHRRRSILLKVLFTRPTLVARYIIFYTVHTRCIQFTSYNLDSANSMQDNVVYLKK